MPDSERSAALHGAIVLAAGGSSRLGRAKQLLLHRGETLVHRAARLALTTTPHDAVIVLGAHAGSLSSHIDDLPIRRVDCADWQTGMGASLRAGVAALAADCAGVLIVLCDQPALDAAHLQALCALWRERPEHGAASLYRGHAGVPALLPRTWFTDLDWRADDRGARDLISARRDRIGLIANEALACDIDHPEDLAQLS
jgi:CTP:molybdopterin cytidylyltransferase MocA